MHDTRGQFPLGAYSAVTEDHPAEEDGLGWATQILPQLEEQAIYDKLKNNNIPGYQGNPWITNHPPGQKGIFSVAHSSGLRPIAGGDTILSMFLCPSVDLPTQRAERRLLRPVAGRLRRHRIRHLPLQGVSRPLQSRHVLAAQRRRGRRDLSLRYHRRRHPRRRSQKTLHASTHQRCYRRSEQNHHDRRIRLLRSVLKFPDLGRQLWR